MSISTISCASCGSAIHPSDEYSEDGCPICGGEIHSEEVKKVQLELEASAREQDFKEIFFVYQGRLWVVF